MAQQQQAAHETPMPLAPLVANPSTLRTRD
jgi:hypothetical protein